MSIRPPLPPFDADTAAESAPCGRRLEQPRPGACRTRILFISEEQRLFRWPLGRRPTEHAGLSELAL